MDNNSLDSYGQQLSGSIWIATPWILMDLQLLGSIWKELFGSIWDFSLNRTHSLTWIHVWDFLCPFLSVYDFLLLLGSRMGISCIHVNPPLGFLLQPWILLREAPMGFPQTPEFLQNRGLPLLFFYPPGSLLGFLSPRDGLSNGIYFTFLLPLRDFFHPPGSPYGISFTSLIPLWDFCHPPGSPYGIIFTSWIPL